MEVNREFVRKLVDDALEAVRIIEEDCSKPFEALSRAERSEVRYYLVVLAEALTALAYHLARRLYGLEPATPAQTLRLLADRGLVSGDELADLEGLVRLRNLLVHRYWVVDDRRIYESIRRDFRGVRRFLERLRGALGVQVLQGRQGGES